MRVRNAGNKSNIHSHLVIHVFSRVGIVTFSLLLMQTRSCYTAGMVDSVREKGIGFPD